MKTGSRAKSLPPLQSRNGAHHHAMESEREQQCTQERGRSRMRNDLMKCPTPPWDRRVDVTFHEEAAIIRSVRGAESLESAREEIVVGRVARVTTTNHGDLESDTYKAIISILNYNKKRQNAINDSYSKVCARLRLTRGRTYTAGESCMLLKLPVGARLIIWGYVMHDDPSLEPKPIRMQAFNPFFKDVWHIAGFENTKELFWSSRGALSSCFSIRMDLLAYVLTTHRFHFVFSPHVKERLCAEMFHWIDQYSHLMRHITIELDLSKLGFGPSSSAAHLVPGNLNVTASVARFTEIQVAHRSMSLANLVLLARRYHGTRAAETEDHGRSKLRQYCPPDGDYGAVFPIVRLSGQIETLRIVGFNASTASCILASLFPDVNCQDPDELSRHAHRADISCVWPFIPGQSTVHRYMQTDVNVRAQYGNPSGLAYVPSSAQRASVARKQFIRLREMLEAYDLRKQSAKGFSGMTTEHPTQKVTRRRTVKIGRFGRKKSQNEGSDRTKNHPGGSSTERKPSNDMEEQRRTSMNKAATTPASLSKNIAPNADHASQSTARGSWSKPLNLASAGSLGSLESLGSIRRRSRPGSRHKLQSEATRGSVPSTSRSSNIAHRVDSRPGYDEGVKQDNRQSVYSLQGGPARNAGQGWAAEQAESLGSGETPRSQTPRTMGKTRSLTDLIRRTPRSSACASFKSPRTHGSPERTTNAVHFQ
ncbi:hypothetical protein JX266_012732 [Neoarthrinium moseri]|nr:hypothetical protein JX266_012732 [Neoarthrinium moseri]